jgi:hypothetical protein
MVVGWCSPNGSALLRLLGARSVALKISAIQSCISNKCLKDFTHLSPRSLDLGPYLGSSLGLGLGLGLDLGLSLGFGLCLGLRTHNA